MEEREFEETEKTENTEKAEKTEVGETNETAEAVSTPEDCFKCRLKGFGEFYLHMVVGVCVLAASSIWLALKVHPFAGLFLAFVTVLVYAVSLEYNLRKKLGLGYSRVKRGAAVSVVDPRAEVKWNREIRRIPERLLWLDVVAIGEKDPKQKSDVQVTTVYIPVSVKKIDKKAFDGMTALTTLVYEGTEEQWSEVEILADIDGIEIVKSEQKTATCSEQQPE